MSPRVDSTVSVKSVTISPKFYFGKDGYTAASPAFSERSSPETTRILEMTESIVSHRTLAVFQVIESQIAGAHDNFLGVDLVKTSQHGF